VLSFFALEQDRRVLCDANANLTRQKQPGEPAAFVEVLHELTGSEPGLSTSTPRSPRTPSSEPLKPTVRPLRDDPAAGGGPSSAGMRSCGRFLAGRR